MDKTHVFPQIWLYKIKLFCYFVLEKQGHILVSRVGFSFEENNWFHCQSFWELFFLGEKMGKILNWVKILAQTLNQGWRIETIVIVVWRRIGGGHIKMNNGPQRYQFLIPLTCGSYLTRKKGLWSCDKAKSLEMGRLSGIIRVVLKFNNMCSSKSRQREIWGQTAKEEAMWSGRQRQEWCSCTSRKRPSSRSHTPRGTPSPQKPLVGTWLFLHLHFGPVTLILDFWLPELWENTILWV